MPRNVAQLTGMVVTAIIVFGTDLDVFYAMPLGIFAGALATLFVAAYGIPSAEAGPDPNPALTPRPARAGCC